MGQRARCLPRATPDLAGLSAASVQAVPAQCLAGDGGDGREVPVVMQQGQAEQFRGGRDDQVYRPGAAMLAAGGEVALYLPGAGVRAVMHLSALLAPPLTTIRQPMRLLGERACSRLLQRIADPTLQPQTERLPTELIIRESCGCEPSPARAPVNG